jgi:hypothetical protein
MACFCHPVVSVAGCIVSLAFLGVLLAAAVVDDTVWLIK